MLFYSMLNRGNKTYDSKILPIMLCRFSNDLFAQKKCRILHNEYLTSRKKKYGYQAFNEYIAD